MFKDTRGRGIYDIFPLDAGQINLSASYPGTIRAFHRHQNQTDCWYVVSGHLEVALFDDVKGELKLIYLSEGEDTALYIPPNIWHGFKVLGNTEAKLLYFVTGRYNAENPDEERAEWNAFYNWQTERK